jgi:hypothetical protein
MTQAQLDRAVCRATGESRELIHQMGFSLLVLPHADHRARGSNRHRSRTYRFSDLKRKPLAPRPA